MAFLVAFFFFYGEYTKPEINSKRDLLSLEGKITNYIFQQVPGHRNTLTQYYFWIDNYPCTFQIAANYVGLFDQFNFEREVRIGDKLRVSIAKDVEEDILDSEKKVIVLSVSTNERNYLTQKDTIEKEKKSSSVLAGLIFMSVGVIYFLLKHFRIIK